MVNPSGNSEPIRCGMCGKPNPVENAVCEFCGARLRPMTAEEMGLAPASPSTPQQPSSAEPSPPSQPASEPDDPLASLRREFMEHDDETIIGPSASQDRIRRQSLYDDVEPDFTIGQSLPARDEDDDEGRPGDIPEWLREASKPPTDTGSLPPSGDVPDWLIEETRPSAAPAPLPADEVEIPDWLGKPGSEMEEAAPPEASRSAPSWSDETSGSQATRPTPTSESMPDWLRDLDASEGSEEEEKPLFEIPDWLNEQTHPAAPAVPDADQSDVDWLRPPQDVENAPEPEAAASDISGWQGESETPEATAEVSESEEHAEPSTTDIPDWMRDAVGASTPFTEAPAAGTPVDEAPIEPSETEMEHSIPDWLMREAGLQSDVEPAASPEPSESEADEVEPAAPLVDSGMPDWLMNLATPALTDRAEPAETPTPADEIPGIAEIEDEAETPPELDANALDWLRLPGEPPEAAPLSSADEQVETGEVPDVPDWLRPPDEETTVEEDARSEIVAPDWMSESESAPEAAADEVTAGSIEQSAPDMPEPEVGIPDWLAELGGEPADEITPEVEEAGPVGEPEVPEWLAGLGGEPAAAAETEAASAGEPEVPEWLAGLGGEPAAPVTSEAEEAAPINERQMPEWIASEPPAATSEAEEAPSVGEPEIPEWLAGLGGEPAPATASGVEEALPRAEPEVPEWLAGLGGEPAAEATSKTEDAESAVPEWLAGLDGEPTSEITPEAKEAAPEVPEWLAGLGGEAATPAAMPEAETEVPDWLSGLGGEPAAPQADEPAIEDEPVVPDWLSGQPTPSGGEAAEPEPALSDDWLADLDDMFSAPVGAAPLTPSTSDELLDLSVPMSPLEAAEEEEADLAETANLPEWLRSAAPEAPGTSRPLEGAADLPPELAGLRFEAITGQRGDQPVTETVGALKDVTGVLRPEILFPGESLRVGALVDQLIVTDEQQRRIRALQNLLTREAQGVVVAEQQSAVPILRWLVALILLGAVVAGLFMTSQGSSPFPAPQPGAGVSAIHAQIESLPAGSTVVLAFEYEPETAAEMQPLAVALMEQLASRNATIYTLSTHPTGPAMADAAMAAAGTGASEQWANLGYISGGSRGISALAIGSLPGMISPLSYDYHGEATGLSASRLADLDPAMIVILTSRWEDLRGWVEQAGPYTDASMVAAMSAGAAPMAYPYAQSGQISGVLSGINDAAAYRTLTTGSPADPLLTTLWNAQAIGGLIAAMMILAGGLMYGLGALRQQEQE